MNAHTKIKQTLEQQRAQHAWKAVQDLSKFSKKDLGNFSSYVDALPAAILMNGLGQAIATELAGKDSGHKKLYDAMQSWLCRGDGTAPYPNQTSLIEAISNGVEKDYLRAQPEALAYLVWLKKFSRALLEPTEGN